VAGKLKARDYSKTLMLAFAVVTCIIITPPEYVRGKEVASYQKKFVRSLNIHTNTFLRKERFHE
jgi:hypothetical protein